MVAVGGVGGGRGGRGGGGGGLGCEVVEEVGGREGGGMVDV